MSRYLATCYSPNIDPKYSLTMPYEYTSLLGDTRHVSISGGLYPRDLATTAAVINDRPPTTCENSWENPKSPNLAV